MTVKRSDFITLATDKFEMALAPDLGGSIVSLRCKTPQGDLDILRGWDAAEEYDPLNMASFPLTPYSNRIINCRLRFEGRECHVGPPFGDEPHQLHGNGWRQPWQVIYNDAQRAVLKLRSPAGQETPYDYTAVQEYSLHEEGVTITLTVTNEGPARLPFGFGHHFYFPRNDKTVFTANLPRVWHNDRLVPKASGPTPAVWDFSAGVIMEDAHFAPACHGFQGKDMLDHCFQGWDGLAIIDWPDKGVRVEIRADEAFRNFVVYIPEGKPFFCAEPVSNINDGFNLHRENVADTGIVILNKGETMKGVVKLAVLMPPPLY